MQFKIRMVAEATFTINPKNYGEPPLSPEEMLAIDIENIETDPEQFLQTVFDFVEESPETHKFEVTGEVVEE